MASIMELQEMGEGQRFNKLYEALDNGFGQGHGAGVRIGSFTDADDELVIGLDKRVESMLRAVATDSETGSEFSLPQTINTLFVNPRSILRFS